MTEKRKWQPYSIGENDGGLFQVPPYLSGLATRPDLAKIWRTRNPDVSFNDFVLADGNILIQDYLPLSGDIVNKKLTNSVRNQLNQPGLNSCTFQIINAWESTRRLTRLLSRFDQKDTVLFFPGNGARTVFSYMISTADTFPASYFISPDLVIKPQLPDITLPLNVVIVDDVVASRKHYSTCYGGLIV